MAAILLIDDDVAFRTALRVMLETTGHHVTEADNGVLGLETFRHQPFDAVFCDLYMPEKEGLETIRELRGLSATIKIVAMSGGSRFGAPDFLPIAVSLGANRGLRKPFGLQELKEVLAELGLS